MENKSKKSKALIITIVIILLLILAGYLLFQNKDAFGVKTSTTISKIFSPLTTSDNTKNLNKIDAEAGEDIKKGDNVSSVGTSSTGNPIVMKTTTGNIFGYADEDINNGNTGRVVLSEGRSNNFWDSFSGFLGDLFSNDVGTETCTNNATNPPMCTTIGDVCMNDANNPPLCDTFEDICDNGATNYPTCDNNTLPQAEGPDLTVTENITPITTTVNTPTTLTSMITNIGTTGTLHSFVSLFTVSKNLDIASTKTTDRELSIIIPTLEAGVGSVAKVSYTFSEEGRYSVRLCADISPAVSTGIILESVTESNENNNCGQTTTITVTNALPQPGTLPQCSDIIDNDADGRIDIDDPNCHLDGDINKAYIMDHTSEATSPIDPNIEVVEEAPTPNICLDIDANPLEFTVEEKAKLAELLRKYYLIAPTLKTQDDIDVTYSEISQYRNFSDYLGVLINQCYDESIDKNGSINTSYEGPTLRFGNPWYKYNTSRDSYIEKDTSQQFIGFDCKYTSGWFTGRGVVTGKDCDTYNQSMYNPNLGGRKAFCTSEVYFINPPDSSCSGGPDCVRLINDAYFAADPSVRATTFQQTQYTYARFTDKCAWHEGVDINNLEKILNVW